MQENNKYSQDYATVLNHKALFNVCCHTNDIRRKHLNSTLKKFHRCFSEVHRLRTNWSMAIWSHSRSCTIYSLQAFNSKRQVLLRAIHTTATMPQLNQGFSSTFMYMPLFLLMVWHQRLKCWNLWGFLWLSVSPGTLHGNLLKSCLAESEEGTCIDLPCFWSHLQLQPCSPLVLLSVDRAPYEVEHVNCSSSGRCLGVASTVCLRLGILRSFDEFTALVMIEILVLVSGITITLDYLPFQNSLL